MVELNGNLYTVKEKNENEFTLFDKDGNSRIPTSAYTSYVEGTTAGGRIDRITGKLVSIEANKQTSRVMLDISAASLVSGTGMKITSGEKMTSGKLLDLVTTSSQAQEGVFSLAADSVEDGVIVKISSDQMKRGSIVDIKTNTASLDASSKLINLQASETPTGTMMKIMSSSLESGKMIRLGAPALKNGTIIEMIDNTALTTGKLLDLRTTSADAVNPVSIVTDNLENGTTFKLHSLN